MLQISVVIKWLAVRVYPRVFEIFSFQQTVNYSHLYIFKPVLFEGLPYIRTRQSHLVINITCQILRAFDRSNYTDVETVWLLMSSFGT